MLGEDGEQENNDESPMAEDELPVIVKRVAVLELQE